MHPKYWQFIARKQNLENMCWYCRTLPLPVNVRQSSCTVQGPQNKHIYLDGDGSSNQPAKLQNSAQHSGSIQVID
jgi:hypothetical protein